MSGKDSNNHSIFISKIKLMGFMERISIWPWIILIAAFLCSCEQGASEATDLDPQEIVGTYGTVRFFSDSEPQAGWGLNLQVEYSSGDTLLLRGDFSFCADSLLAYLQGDSLIIPLQSFAWTNQSPGGSTWTEYKGYEGTGRYDRDQHKLSLHFENYADSDWDIEGVKEAYLDLTGSYLSNGAMKDLGHRRAPSPHDRLNIALNPTSDTLMINFVFDYLDQVDSALQQFKLPFTGCVNACTLQVDSINSLEVNLIGNGEYARLSVGRLSTVPFGYYNSTYYTNYYQFGGFITAPN